jgi:Outer membrane receptor proteins, mostly Fe transport
MVRIDGAASVVAMAVALAIAGPVYAQERLEGEAATGSAAQQADAASSASDSDARDGDIVVTARRRAEREQSVPIAITALGQEELERQNIQDFRSLQRTVPSMSITGQTNDYQAISIRGQGLASQRSQAGVVVYLNEVPVCCDANGQTIGGPSLLYDLENVQVLKGPQGTLFGRNAIGGAVLIQTHRPEDSFGGYLTGTLGNYNDRELTGALNVPVSDTLSVRVAGFYQERKGYTKVDTAPNGVNGLRQDDIDVNSQRVSVHWEPVDGIQTDLIYQRIRSRNHGSAFLLTALSPGLQPLLGAYFAQQQAAGIRRIPALSSPVFYKLDYDSVTGLISVDLSSDVVLRNIASWSSNRSVNGIDYDASPFPILDFPTTRFPRIQWTEELQLQGTSFGGRFDWAIGGYLSDIPVDKSLLGQAVFFFAPLENNVQFESFGSKALYAQGTFSLRDNLKLTGGFRYTWDDQYAQVISLDENGVCTPVSATRVPGSDAECKFASKDKWSAPAWTLGIDYQATPRTLIYLQHRHAYRTGGFNTAADARNTDPFDPETVDDIELGIKSDWSLFGMPIRTNAAVYHQWYDDLQTTIGTFDPVSNSFVAAVRNAGSATLFGAELEVTLRPTPGLELGAFGSYLDFDYKKFLSNANPADVARLTNEENGGRIPFKYGLSAQYTHELGGNETISFGSNWNWEQGLDPGVSFSKTKSYGLLTFNAGWNNIGGAPIDLSLFVNNATNRKVRFAYNPLNLYDSGLYNLGAYVAPRMYGARLTFRFGNDAN